MSTPTLSSQNPAPSTVTNLLRPSIGFTIDCDIGVLTSSIRIYINSVLAYDGSTTMFQNGFVPSVDWNTFGGILPFGNSVFVALNQLAFFTPAETVSVRVVATDSANVNTMDVTYSFSTDTVATPPYFINIFKGSAGVATLADPFCFDAILDPYDVETIDPTTLLLNWFIGFPAFSGGSLQNGYTMQTSAILGGYHYEFRPPTPEWTFEFQYQTLQISSTGGSPRTSALYSGSLPWSSEFTANPGNGASIGLGPITQQLDVLSLLGTATLLTLDVTQNALPPQPIFGGGVFLGIWGGTQTPTNQGPFPPGVNQTNEVDFSSSSGFTSGGDTLLFSFTAQITSPFTGATYPISGSWTETVMGGPPPQVTITPSPNPPGPILATDPVSFLFTPRPGVGFLDVATIEVTYDGFSYQTAYTLGGGFQNGFTGTPASFGTAPTTATVNAPPWPGSFVQFRVTADDSGSTAGPTTYAYNVTSAAPPLTIEPTGSPDPGTVERDGGYPLTLSGFPADATYTVHVGPLGTTADPICPGGLGSGQVCTALSGQLSLITPPLPPGGPYAFTFVRLSGGGPSEFTTSPLLTVAAYVFKGTSFNFKRRFPPQFFMGSRDPREVPPQ